MASPRAKRLSLRTTGLIVALGVFLIACGVLGLIAVWSRPGGAGPIAARQPALAMPNAPGNLTQIGLQNAGRARIQFVDKNDPQRVTGFLEWASLEPTGPGRAVMNEPRAELYMSNGQTVQVRANGGTMVYPAGKPTEAESGTFEGGVTVELLARGEIDQAGKTLARAFTPALAFSRALAELSADGRIRVSGEQFEFSGAGLRLVANEVQSRMELLAVDRVDYLWIAPSARTAAKPGTERAAKPTEASTPSAGRGTEVFYNGQIAGAFTLIRGPLTITGDKLVAWARLVDGSLPAGASGPERAAMLSESGAAGATQPAEETAKVVRQRSAPIADEPPSLFAALEDADLIELKSGVPLTIKPQNEQPAELSRDDVAIACSGTDQNPVHAIDTVTNGSATVARLSYGATTGILEVRRGEQPARVARQEAGSFEFDELSLNARTGLGTTRGAARLAAAGASGQEAREISWKDGGEFQLEVRDGQVAARPLEATFRGDVQARDGLAVVRGDSARVVFSRDEGARPVESLLRQVQVRGNVSGDDGRGGKVAGGELDVDLEASPTGKSADPKRVAVRGGAVAERDGWRIEARTLDALLERDAHNDVVVTTATARGGASVAGREITAKADHIAADMARQIIDLQGAPAMLWNKAGTITGDQMRLEGLREELFVFGSGTMQAHGTAEPPTSQRASVKWQKSMQFNNLDGKGECAGDVEVVSTPSAIEEETLRAERVLLTFTPGRGLPDLTAPDGSKAAAANPVEERRLLRAEAIGASEEREGGARASVESKVFAAGASGERAPAREVERLIYAEGDRLIADQVEESLTVPSAGRLLIDDRRGGGSEPADAASRRGLPSDLSGARGSSLFRWEGMLRFTREDGALSLRGKVRVLHRDTPQAQVLSIDADTATARLRVPGSAESETSGAATKQAELLSAACEGSVIAELKGKRLDTDLLTFDARTGVLEASTQGRSLPTITEPGNPTPLIARKLQWDTRKNTQRIIEAAVTAPR